MTHTNTGRGLVAAIAAAAILTLGGCGDDTESIPSDEAEEELGDLQDEIDEKLDEAGEAVDEGVARGQAELFKQQLTELGGDDTPSRAVSDLERIASDLPGDPEVTGIEDDDGDGDDDDGKVQITVDDSSACVTIGASSVEVSEGSC